MRVLVAGWFSFPDGHATAGDLLARDLACEWLKSAGYEFDIAVAPPFQGGINLFEASPEIYSHAVFVCGPFEKKALEAQFLGRFANSYVIGLDLTMITPLDEWNPFDALFERDSSVTAHPDIVFLSRTVPVPVVGVCLVEPYEGAITDVANAAINRLIASRKISVVQIDTRLDQNSTGLRSPSEIESLLAHMDVVVTTRLHGLVLALKNGVPAIAIDPEAGGAKIKRQAETIGWTQVFTADGVSDEALQKAFDYSLTEEARARAIECSKRAAKMVEEIRCEFITTLSNSITLSRKTEYRRDFASAFPSRKTRESSNSNARKNLKEQVLQAISFWRREKPL